jgi:hypothetical protein
MAAPKGNDYALKLKDPEVKQEAYRQYCEVIASGMPKETFKFKHPTISLTSETMDKYIKESPEDFDPILMQAARADRYRYWMTEGLMLMRGKYRGGSPVVWQTIMRNIFKDIGWDRETLQEDTSEAARSHTELMRQLADMQKKA